MTTTTADPAAPAADAKAPRSKKKLIIIAVVLLAVLGGVYQFVLRDSGPAEPVPGEVLVLEPIQLNLEGGHYLRVGLALQLTETAHELDGSKALDATIAMLSGRSIADLSARGEHAHIKEELLEVLHEAYHGDVMEVYFTEFVTQ